MDGGAGGGSLLRELQWSKPGEPFAFGLAVIGSSRDSLLPPHQPPHRDDCRPTDCLRDGLAKFHLCCRRTQIADTPSPPKLRRPTSIQAPNTALLIASHLGRSMATVHGGRMATALGNDAQYGERTVRQLNQTRKLGCDANRRATTTGFFSVLIASNVLARWSLFALSPSTS